MSLTPAGHEELQATLDPTEMQSPQRGPVTDHHPQGTDPGDRDAPGVRHTRISGAWTAVVVAVLLGVALIVFIVQNTESVRIKFFGASGHVPIAVALLAAALIGGIVVLVVGVSRITQLRIAARRRTKGTKGAAPDDPSAN